MSTDGLRHLPDHVTAQLLRAFMTLPAPRPSRLVLRRVEEPRAPFHDASNDFNVIFRDQKVGRIDLDLQPYMPAEAREPCASRVR